MMNIRTVKLRGTAAVDNHSPQTLSLYKEEYVCRV